MHFNTSPFIFLTRSITIFTMLMSGTAFGQFKYETLSNSDGLSQGYVSDILQDREGFLWFTTKAGLNRYDGYTFKVYMHDAYDVNSISSNETAKLYEDSQGRIWVGTADGLNVYDKTEDRFRRIISDPKNPNTISGNRIINQIVELDAQNFLVYSSEKSYNIITIPPDFFKKNSSPFVTHVEAPNQCTEHIQVIFKDAKNRVWVNSCKKLYEFIPEKKSFVWRKDNVYYLDYNLNDDGTAWVNDNNFSLMDGATNYPLFTKSIAGDDKSVLAMDNNQRLWVGISRTNKLLAYDTKSWSKGTSIDPEKSLIFEDDEVATRRLFKDRSGLLWLATNGYGLRKYSFESERFNHLAQGVSIRKITSSAYNEIILQGWSSILSLSLDGKDTENDIKNKFNELQDFFISKNGEIYYLKSGIKNNTPYIVSELEKYDPKTKKSQKYPIHLRMEYQVTEPIIEDRKGNIWICGINGDIVVVNPITAKAKQFSINTEATRPMLASALITAMYEDSNGIIWIGTEEGMVKLVYDHLTSQPPKVVWYRSGTLNKNSLNFSHVSCFLDDPIDNNLLWINTKGGGLNLLEKTTGKFTHITTKEGLCNDVVYGTLADTEGNIWGSTNFGIFCLLKKRKDEYGNWQFRHFTKGSGLQDDEFNTGAYAKLPNGDLAFGGVKGISVFNPVTVLQSGFTPNVFITNILVGNKIVTPNDNSGVLKQAIESASSITLNHLQDILTLEFSSLDFTAPNQNKYRYQLVGIDRYWVESGTRRTATYLHLPSGSYTFKLQGSNSLGIWNDKVRELTIKILPPWYASWFAYLLYVTLLGLGIRAYYRYKLNQNKMATKLQFEQNETNRIKELDKVKTDLYTNITHEFRTPLTVILGMVQHIRRSAADHLENGLDMIERNGNNLLRLVNEMLDLSKLEAGKMELNLIQGDVLNFIRYIVESFHSVAESQDKKMHYLSSVDTMYVKYDEEKIRQIVSNLLSNALKFTSKKGDIYLSISQDNNNHLCLKVKDTGEGIPDSQLHHIFDRFYQADSTHTRHAEGTGIGLALTKELVQLMDGQISVKSPPIGFKKGTEFTVILPLEIISDYLEKTAIKKPAIIVNTQADDNHQTRHIDYQNQTNSDKELILLVEDNTDVVAYTASCLQEYRLAVGKDGQEGLDIARDLIPDLIITDVMMPFMDGFEMTRILRLDELTSHIPIIMITAKADMDSKLEGIEHGAEVYLEKPFNVDELTLRVRKLLDQRMILQRAYASKMGLQSSSAMKSHVEVDQRHIDGIVIPKRENEFVKKVTSDIEAHLSEEDFGVNQLAKNLFMSYSQVQRKLNALIGLSPNQYIRFMRLEKSKELLRSTDDTILNISMNCGFSDPSYFAKVFKQEFGMTPHEWRVLIS